jgi:F420H(2)-dependent quinone reductase
MLEGSPVNSTRRTLEAKAVGSEHAQDLSRGVRIGLAIQRTLDRRLSALSVGLYRRTRGAFPGSARADFLLLTTHGRRSGRERTVMVRFFRLDGDLILAAANDGGASHPGWFHNLTAEPTARVQVLDRSFAVRAERLSDAEAAAFWPRILDRAPSYDRYGRATNRTIPLVRLVA